MNPAVTQWIEQLADPDQAVAFYAYQSLQEEALRTRQPAALAVVLGKELVAEARPGEGGSGGPASFRNNAFLTAAAEKTATPLHPARVRARLARLLGYLPDRAAVPYLTKALADLETREMARQALDSNPTNEATAALARALDAVGPEFLVGVVNSLAKRTGETAPPRLCGKPPRVRSPRSASPPFTRWPGFPTRSTTGSRTGDPAPHRPPNAVPRTSPASGWPQRSLLGNKSAAERISKAVVSGDAPEPQKKAARLVLGEPPITR